MSFLEKSVFLRAVWNLSTQVQFLPGIVYVYIEAYLPDKNQ